MNISAKHDGQLTVARRALQKPQRRASGSAGAPQFGQRSDAASGDILFRIARAWLPLIGIGSGSVIGDQWSPGTGK